MQNTYEPKTKMDDDEMAKEENKSCHTRKRLRRSAARALTRIKKYKEDQFDVLNIDSDDKELEEYKMPPENEENVTSEESEIEEEKVIEKQPITFSVKKQRTKAAASNQSIRSLLSSWEGYYELHEEVLNVLSKKMFKEWRKELQQHKMIKCKNEGCGKKFVSFHGIKYHASRCKMSKKSKSICLLCNNNFASAKFLLSHMKRKHNSPNTSIKQNDKTHRKTRIKIQQTLRSALIAYDFHSKNDENVSFLDLNPKVENWRPLSDSEKEQYLPLQKHSVNFRFQDAKSNWTKLGLFENFSINDDLPNRTFYVGGPVWAAAWCPIPINVSAEQYVALSYCRNAEEIHNLVPATDETRKTLIQIWCMGDLPKDNYEIPQPTLRLAIAVNYGEIWNLSWCPSGCWENSLTYLCSINQNNKLPRLGLLSAACGDGCIRIYSIPHPICLHRNYGHSNAVIYQAQPVFLLKPPQMPNNGICTSISWQATGGCRRLAGGYSNGLVCCWDLLTTSPLLETIKDGQKVLIPYNSFFGGTSLITDLCWCPYENTQFLAVSSSDRNLKIWDLKNPSRPINFKAGVLRSIHWSRDQHGLYFSNDNSHSFNTNAQFLNYTSGQQTSSSEHGAPIWNISVSDWHNIIASADLAGEIVGAAFQDTTNWKKEHRWKHRFPIYRMELRLLHLDPNTKELVEKQVPSPSGSLDSGIQDDITTEEKTKDNCCERDTIPDETYKEINQNYGLVISDFGDCSLVTLPEKEHERLKKREQMNAGKIESYPLASINVVMWNPNYGYSSWLFSAGQAGLARLTRVKNAGVAAKASDPKKFDVELINSQPTKR